MSDLTGGVAGRFSTKDASFDRLFVYFYRLQRYCLWVARPAKDSCQKHGIVLDGSTGDRKSLADTEPRMTCGGFVVNRAAPFQGETYIQLFSTGYDTETGAFNNVHIDGGGLQSYSVPDELLSAFPEKPGSGYFWVHMLDFWEYFDTVFECRLTNSPDVGLKDMPDFPQKMHLHKPLPVDSQMPGPRLFKEQVWANQGEFTPGNTPEFDIFVPGAACPVDITAVLEQANPRVSQLGKTRPPLVPLLLKVYQQSGAGGNNYSENMVCKSNWLPVRDSMVSFCAKSGGRFLVTCGFPKIDDISVNSLVFRCYATCDGITVAARRSTEAHAITDPIPGDGPKAIKWTLVGCRSARRSDECAPEPYDPHSDGLSINEDGQKQCAVM